MSYQQFTGDFTDQLASGYTAGGTTLVLTSVTGLPTSGNFIVRVDTGTNAEYFLCTSINVSTKTLTVVGAQDGTANVSHSGGAVVTGVWITPTVLNALKTDIGNIVSDDMPLGTAKGVKDEYLVIASPPTTAENILLNISGFAGYVDYMWIACDCNYSINIYIDGEGSPSFNLVPQEHFFFNQDVTVNYQNDWMMNMGGQTSYVRIPFTTGIKIAIVGTGYTGGTVRIWYDITYQRDITPPAYGKKLQISDGHNDSATQDQVLTLINISGRGRIFAIFWMLDTTNASNHTLPLEGNWNIYIDADVVGGTPTIPNSGAEDFFNMSGYFGSASAPTTNNNVGLVLKTTNKYGAYRFFTKDPKKFETAIKVTWNNGESARGSFTGTTRVHWAVLYYLD